MIACSTPSRHGHGTSGISGGALRLLICRDHCTGSRVTAGILLLSHTCVTREDERRNPEWTNSMRSWSMSSTPQSSILCLTIPLFFILSLSVSECTRSSEASAAAASRALLFAFVLASRSLLAGSPHPSSSASRTSPRATPRARPPWRRCRRARPARTRRAHGAARRPPRPCRSSRRAARISSSSSATTSRPVA